MVIPPKPSNERERLEVLQSCGVLDSEPEPAYDDIARIATQVCLTPIGLVSLIDDRRQWFKSRIGMATTETSRDLAFCAHAIMTPTRPLVVRDTLHDERFFDNPLVTGAPYIRFYAGIPLVLDEGAAVGTLCVIDRVPRDLSPHQIEALALLARQITNELRLRRKLAALQPRPAPPAQPRAATEGCSTVRSDILGETPLPLDTIAGRYRIGEILGVGGMGLVVSATDLESEREVAIKFLLPDARLDPGKVEQFVREARTLMRVRGEHVAQILDAGNLGNGAPFIVMERLVGQDLHTLLESRQTLSVVEAADYVAQACAGMARVHAAGILHHDLKPSNLFLTRREGASPTVKVLDFGVATPWLTPEARADDAAAESRAGSPQYMSPERMTHGTEPDARSDVWSLGVILFEMLAGVRPFEAESVAEICEQVLTARAPRLSLWRNDLPPGLEAIVARCLRKDRDKRFASVDELARTLTEVVAAPRGAEAPRVE